MALRRRTNGYALPIERGRWHERLEAWIAEAREEAGGRPRLALLIEAGAEGQAAHLEPFGRSLEIVRLGPFSAPLRLSDVLERLQALHRSAPLAFAAIAGGGDRADARAAAWKLGALAAARWLFLHDARAHTGAFVPLRAHVSRYLEIIDGVAYHEGAGG